MSFFFILLFKNVKFLLTDFFIYIELTLVREFLVL